MPPYQLSPGGSYGPHQTGPHQTHALISGHGAILSLTGVDKMGNHGAADAANVLLHEPRGALRVAQLQRREDLGPLERGALDDIRVAIREGAHELNPAP